MLVIFVYGVRKCYNFIFLQVAVQISQHHLLKRPSLPYCIFLLPLPKIRYPQVHGFISRLSILFPAKTMATHSSTLAWEIPWTESLVGYSPWGREESDTTERLHFYFSLSCTGEGNGNPLQYSCLENPRDGSLVGCCLWGHTESDTTAVT